MPPRVPTPPALEQYRQQYIRSHSTHTHPDQKEPPINLLAELIYFRESDLQKETVNREHASNTLATVDSLLKERTIETASIGLVASIQP